LGVEPFAKNLAVEVRKFMGTGELSNIDYGLYVEFSQQRYKVFKADVGMPDCEDSPAQRMAGRLSFFVDGFH
jgi:hypothetical protein